MSLSKKYELSIRLRKLLGFNQVEYFPDDAKKLATDWYLLDDLLGSAREELPFYDYSFALAPLYKAIETVLYKIASELELVIDGAQLGAFFGEDNLEKVLPSITEKVKDFHKSKVIKGELSEIKTFLVRYRHIPAHSGSRFENLDQERAAAQSALHNIKCLLTDLLNEKVIQLPKRNVSDNGETGGVDVENIPF